jgi:4-hydroxybenzoate polyprenyltransferase
MTTEAVARDAAREAVPRRSAGGAVDLIRLARPIQWSKNALAVPLVLAAGAPWSGANLLRVAWAVLVFCLASSLIYILNDIADRELDRDHPAKRDRPIASGRVSVPAARLYAASLGVALGIAAVVASSIPWWPLYLYVALNLAYSRWLKHVPLLDICVVSAGFGLRAVQGYAATGTPVSGWMLVAVLAACLMLIVGKRRHELATVGSSHRPALRGYNVALADQLLTINAVLATVALLLYVRFDAPVGDLRVALSGVVAPLALFGLFRYLQSVLVRHQGGDPVWTLLSDRVLVADAVLLATVLIVTTALPGS